MDLLGVPVKYYWVYAGELIAFNFITESFITTLNTPDLTDAVFGCIGAAAGLIMIFILNKLKRPIKSHI